MSPELEAVVAGWNVVTAPDRESWLDARRRYLTASDVAAVLGLHPFKSRAKVVAEKQAGLAGGDRPWTFESSAMRAGQYLEAPVMQWWADDQRMANVRNPDKYPLRLVSAGVVRGLMGESLLVSHPDPGLRLAASPDGVLLWERGDRFAELVEVKVHGPKQWANWVGAWSPKQVRAAVVLGLEPSAIEEEGEVADWPCPIQHWVQLQTQLLCTGVGSGWVVGNCGSERREHHFEADYGFHERVVAAAREFWAEVDPGPLDVEL